MRAGKRTRIKGCRGKADLTKKNLDQRREELFGKEGLRRGEAGWALVASCEALHAQSLARNSSCFIPRLPMLSSTQSPSFSLVLAWLSLTFPTLLLLELETASSRGFKAKLIGVCRQSLFATRLAHDPSPYQYGLHLNLHHVWGHLKGHRL